MQFSGKIGKKFDEVPPPPPAFGFDVVFRLRNPGFATARIVLELQYLNCTMEIY